MTTATGLDIMAAGLPEFGELVRAHQRMVFSIAYHFLLERSVAEDLAQDVFLQLHRALPEAHVTAWLRKVTDGVDVRCKCSGRSDLQDSRQPGAARIQSEGSCRRQHGRQYATIGPQVVLNGWQDLSVEFQRSDEPIRAEPASRQDQ